MFVQFLFSLSVHTKANKGKEMKNFVHVKATKKSNFFSAYFFLVRILFHLFNFLHRKYGETFLVEID